MNTKLRQTFLDIIKYGLRTIVIFMNRKIDNDNEKVVEYDTEVIS